MEEYPSSNSTPGTETTEPTPPVKTEKEIVDRIQKLKKSYEQSSVDSRKEFQEIFAVYSGNTDEIQSTPYSTHDDIPKLRTEVAYVKPFIFSGDPVVEFEGIGDEDKAISKIYEKMVNHRFATIPDFSEKIEASVGQMVTFGTSEVKVIWRFATKEVTDDAPGLDGKPQTYEQPIQDEPDIEVPNHLDVYFNPIVSSIKDQECMIFRSVLSISEVKENPIYDYKNLEGARNADNVTESGGQTDNYNSSVLANTDIPASQQKATAGMVEVLELIDDDRIQTIAGDLVLRDIANPYGFKNVVKMIFEPNAIPNRYEGYGVGQNTQGLGKMFYRQFNQIATNVKMTNNPMFYGKKGSVKDKRQLVSKPGGFIEVEGDGPIDQNFGQVDFTSANTTAFELLNKLDDEHKRASGANDLIQGSASNDTLGQDNIAQANISNRFELIVRRFKGSLSAIAGMILKMELQNLQSPDADILRIFPEELREQIFQVLISEKDNVKFNITIRGETNVARNKNIEGKRLVEMFNIASAVQTATGPLLTNDELRAWLRRIMELQGEQNVDEIIAETAPQPQIDPMTGMPMQPGQPMNQGMPVEGAMQDNQAM